jgi:hypothetical protein
MAAERDGGKAGKKYGSPSMVEGPKNEEAGGV